MNILTSHGSIKRSLTVLVAIRLSILLLNVAHVTLLVKCINFIVALMLQGQYMGAI